MSNTSAGDRWQKDRTTFQRVYDLLVGTQSFLPAQEFAERADCSETAARNALEQLAEMGIAQRRDGRPARYQRNESYLRWKRIESLTREHGLDELQDRLNTLIEADKTFQEKYGVPEPDAVSSADLPLNDHEAIHDRWEGLSEWRTVRRDIRLFRQAIDRAYADDGVHA